MNILIITSIVLYIIISWFYSRSVWWDLNYEQDEELQGDIYPILLCIVFGLFWPIFIPLHFINSSVKHVDLVRLLGWRRKIK